MFEHVLGSDTETRGFTSANPGALSTKLKLLSSANPRDLLMTNSLRPSLSGFGAVVEHSSGIDDVKGVVDTSGDVRVINGVKGFASVEVNDKVDGVREVVGGACTDELNAINASDVKSNKDIINNVADITNIEDVKSKKLKFKMAEDNKTLRKIMREICNTDIRNDERLFTGEEAGRFAVRYMACLLCKRAEKLKMAKNRYHELEGELED